MTQQFKSLTNKVNNHDQQIRNTEERQLKLTSDVKNHGHGNQKRIEDLSVILTARLNDTEEQIKSLATNFTHETASFGTLFDSLSLDVRTFKAKMKYSNVMFIKLLKPSIRNETIEKSLLALENELQPTSSIFFGTETIGLWDMGGKYSAGQV